jgi:hypothetical protein
MSFRGRKWGEEKKMRGENKYFLKKALVFGKFKVFLQFFIV